MSTEISCGHSFCLLRKQLNLLWKQLNLLWKQLKLLRKQLKLKAGKQLNLKISTTILDIFLRINPLPHRDTF